MEVGPFIHHEVPSIDDLTTALTTGVLAMALGGLFCAGGVRRLSSGRVLGAITRLVPGAGFLFTGLTIAAIVVNLHTYHRLTYETPVARVSFVQLADQHYRATLTPATGKPFVMDIHGNEWQLDARVLKWRGYAALLGLNPRYRLERFSGRFQDIEDERTRPRSVYDLSSDRGLDLWRYARASGLSLVDAVYGSASYLPMADEAVYEVSLSPSGLIARAANTPASEAVQGW